MRQRGRFDVLGMGISTQACGRRLMCALLVLALGACAKKAEPPGVRQGAGRAARAEHVVWASALESSSRCVVGGIAGDTHAPWLAWEMQPDGAVLCGLRWDRGEASAVHPPPAEMPQRLFPGARSPRLVRFTDGEMLLVASMANPGGSDTRHARQGASAVSSSEGDERLGVVAWRVDHDGHRWGGPLKVSGRRGRHVEIGNTVVTHEGALLVPVLWHPIGADGATLVLHVSTDRGATWREVSQLTAGDLGFPALASLQGGQGGRLLLVAQRNGMLVAAESTDGGIGWSPWRDIGIEAAASGVALARVGQTEDVVLAWTDPPPDTTQALPPLQALRLAMSHDGGVTWSAPLRLTLRPGRVPVSPVMLADSTRLLPAFVERTSAGRTTEERVVCLGFEWQNLREPRRIALAAARYGIDPAAARASLAILCAHTLARPEEPRRLFVEGYFMRSLLAAQEAFDAFPEERPDWFAAGACGESALAWADTLVATQLPMGYWKTGYGAVFVADMAAALGIFPALESRAGAERLPRWEAAARRFLAALEEDGMILPDGACGVGWPGAAIPRVVQRVSRTPYLVSTALAGVELNAWLAHRSGDERDRARALRSLDWTLAQVRDDGALPPGPKIAGSEEGALTGAVYVQEGWMAADLLLGGKDVERRLRAVLPRHVDWILRQQRPDGTWDSGADGELARTPAMVNFLLWYDRRIEQREDVRAAIGRAGLRLADPAQWQANGLFRVGHHHEVLRAHAGRVLAALAREMPVW